MKAKRLALLVFVTAVLTFSFSSAEVPQMINYQGKLTDSTGAPLDTTVSMRFRIYADSTTSTYLWTETHSSVTVDEGLFNVLLGSVTAIPDSVFDGSMRYLGTKVGSDSEMTPRGKLVSVGYAFHSGSADTAEYARVMAPDNDWVINGDDIYHPNGNVGIGTTPDADYKLYIRHDDNDFAKLVTSGGIGVYGRGEVTGVEGRGSKGVFGYGAWGYGEEPYEDALGVKGLGSRWGVVGSSQGATPGIGAGILGLSDGNAYAGWFKGDVNAEGIISMTGFKMPAGAASGYVLTSDASGVGTWAPGGGGADNDWIISGNNMYAAVSGNVGIGTTSPNTKLTILGPSGATTDRLFQLLKDGGYGGTAFYQYYVTSQDFGLIVGQDNTDYTMRMNVDPGNQRTDFKGTLDVNGLIVGGGTSGIKIDSDGNVGIGTTDPSEKLEVAGTVKATNANGNWGTLGSSGSAVYGYSGSGYGVFGSSNSGYGVKGIGSGSSTNYGVYGETKSVTGYGVYGYGHNGSYAVYGRTRSGTGGYAGYFAGNVNVTGTLSKGGGSFKIDHPLDPENKYLYHSFVESPDMMNVYNGNVMLDGNGEATVDLPDYFEALNGDFRYQLTAIGAPGPDLYIAEEISDNRFNIAGGEPGMKVSWQVTGVRKDAFAEANRIQVEVDKPVEEQGKYLHPEAHGFGEEHGIHYEEHKRMEEQLQQKSVRKMEQR